MKTFGKTLFLVLMSLSILALNSCEKDEGEQAASDLVGTWTVQSSILDVSVGGVFPYQRHGGPTILLPAHPLQNTEARYERGLRELSPDRRVRLGPRGCRRASPWDSGRSW